MKLEEVWSAEIQTAEESVSVVRELTLDELISVSGGPQVVNDGGSPH